MKNILIPTGKLCVFCGLLFLSSTTQASLSMFKFSYPTTYFSNAEKHLSDTALRIHIGKPVIGPEHAPLIVVNEQPFTGSIPADFNFGKADEKEYAELLKIKTTDIESISILKNTAETAKFGPKAKNGVLIIHTKSKPIHIGKPVIGPEHAPLIVVNDIPFTGSIPSDFDFGKADEKKYAELLKIKATDIESISVLKNILATEKFGTKAKNGVLIINTKPNTK